MRHGRNQMQILRFAQNDMSSSERHVILSEAKDLLFIAGREETHA